MQKFEPVIFLPTEEVKKALQFTLLTVNVTAMMVAEVTTSAQEFPVGCVSEVPLAAA